MPERGTLDVSKAKKLLGYKPINPIEKVILNIFHGIKILGKLKMNLNII